MAKQLTPSDVYDVNKKTGALILGANRLDDYAEKFLGKYCRAALTTPMSLPVEKMLADAGYPNGFETTLYCENGLSAMATLIQASLADLNIKVDVQFVANIADWRESHWKDAK